MPVLIFIFCLPLSDLLSISRLSIHSRSSTVHRFSSRTLCKMWKHTVHSTRIQCSLSVCVGIMWGFLFFKCGVYFCNFFRSLFAFLRLDFCYGCRFVAAYRRLLHSVWHFDFYLNKHGVSFHFVFIFSFVPLALGNSKRWQMARWIQSQINFDLPVGESISIQIYIYIYIDDIDTSFVCRRRIIMRAHAVSNGISFYCYCFMFCMLMFTKYSLYRFIPHLGIVRSLLPRVLIGLSICLFICVRFYFRVSFVVFFHLLASFHFDDKRKILIRYWYFVSFLFYLDISFLKFQKKSNRKPNGGGVSIGRPAVVLWKMLNIFWRLRIFIFMRKSHWKNPTLLRATFQIFSNNGNEKCLFLGNVEYYVKTAYNNRTQYRSKFLA